MTSQRAKRARLYQKEAEFLGLPRSVAHPSHTSGVRRYEKAQKRRKNLSSRVISSFVDEV